MKKKFAVFVSVVVLAVAVAAATAIVNRKPTLTGRAIVINSTILIADESDMPVQLNPKTEKVFQDVTIHTGDLIRITYDGYFLYSSPAQTIIDKIQVLERGSVSDVPEKAIEVLNGNYKWPID